VLLPIFPVAFKSLAVRVVQRSEAIALIGFKLSIIDLTVRPHINSLSVLLAALERTIVKSAIGPLVKPVTAHGVV
jgi:hypothetical protein